MKRLLALFTLVFTLTALSLPASATAAVEGRDYVRLAQPQPVSVKRGEIEVLEFFWYRCPHCFNLEPALEAWARKQRKDVVLRRVPAVLNPNWMPLARAFYALEAIGERERLHHEVFDAIHVRGMDLNPPEAFFDWAVTKGVERKRLADAYHGFAVNTQVMRAQQLSNNYRLSGVPAVVVQGKYVTSAAMTGSEEALFATIDFLIEQERKAGTRR